MGIVASDGVDLYHPITEPKDEGFSPLAAGSFSAKLAKIFCRCGWHWFEREPSIKYFLKETGQHFVFSSQCIQKAVKRCRTAGCETERRVYRKGWVHGFGGNSKPSRWKRLNQEMEQYIDKCPKL